MTDHIPDERRRLLLRALALTPIVIASPGLLTSCSTGSPPRSGAGTDTPSLQPTLACGDDDEPAVATESQTEGPYFSRNSPERKSLVEGGVTGTLLTVSGVVTTRSCRPVQGALLDFWQADDSGEYDNNGFRLRGHQFTDANGAYRLETIVPGLYPGRTRHIHVKVQAPNEPVLTTQLYFPGEAQNASDGIFHDSLLLALSGSGSQRDGKFNFVLDLA